MQLELRGQPIHTRVLTVEIAARDDEHDLVTADLLDLRKRGFTPVATELQGAGIIHQMGVCVLVARATRTIAQIEARQPVVAFEASPATAGESCRDVVGGLQALVGMRIDERSADRLRDAVGGAAGCSHLFAAAQCLCATLIWWDTPERQAVRVEAPVHRRRWRRDLVIDGCEVEPGHLEVGIQVNDLESMPAAAAAAPRQRFIAHDELRVRLALHGWPAVIGDAVGAERRRTAADFATAAWADRSEHLAPLRGVSLGKGSNRAIMSALAAYPALRDALLQLAPALIQCRASFPDKWLNLAITRPDHAGLIGMPDSCYMWRRGGALERARGGTATDGD